MRKGRFFCLIGIDGSGKTTIAKMLAQENDKWEYVHALYLTRLLWPFLWFGRTFLLCGKDKRSNPEEYSSSKKKVVKGLRILNGTYIVIALMDYLSQVFLEVYLPLKFGVNLICDRYLYDTMINISMNTNYDAIKIDRLLTMWFKLFPKPDLTILLDLDEDVAWNRKNDIPSKYYLKERRELYLSLAKLKHFKVVDSNQSLQIVYSQIESFIKK